MMTVIKTTLLDFYNVLLVFIDDGLRFQFKKSEQIIFQRWLMTCYSLDNNH